jgi:hypothetical protein
VVTGKLDVREAVAKLPEAGPEGGEGSDLSDQSDVSDASDPSDSSDPSDEALTEAEAVP